MKRVDRNDLTLIRRLSPLVGVDYPVVKRAEDVPPRARLKIYGGAARAANARGLDSITLSRSGRAGNNIIQLVQGLIIAEQAKIPVLRHRFDMFGLGPRAAPVRLKFGKPRSWSAEVGLRGRFFLRGQSAYLRQLNAKTFLETLDRYARPAFRWRTPPEAGLLALNLRGGTDIFAQSVPPSQYGQPPLSYYIAAAETAIAAHDIKRIAIVHQDNLNPVLPGLIQWAENTSLPTTCISSGPEGDARTLLAAEHIVMGCTTFTESLSLLSDGLISLSTFGTQHLVEMLDLAVPVRRRFEDDGTYQPTKIWTGSPEQRNQMVTFPLSALSMTEERHPEASLRRERLRTAPKRWPWS
ncbi:MAG: hypothetical protein ACPG4X_08295 [Pikeienuella sp.]